MKFSIKDFFNKCDQIRRKLRIWSHLLKKSLMENFNFCAVIQPLRPCHLTILPPFSPCHLTTFIHFSHLTSSLLSYLSQLTTLPTTNRPLQNSNILRLGRQGKHVWLIVGQLFMKPGRWDAPLALLDLAEAISITRSKISTVWLNPQPLLCTPPCGYEFHLVNRLLLRNLFSLHKFLHIAKAIIHSMS